MEDRVGWGKKRLVSNFTIAHSRKSIHMSKKSGQEAEMCYHVKVTIRTKIQAFLNAKKWTKEKKMYHKTVNINFIINTNWLNWPIK